jgi:hypothetical protein
MEFSGSLKTTAGIAAKNSKALIASIKGLWAQTRIMGENCWPAPKASFDPLIIFANAFNLRCLATARTKRRMEFN